MHRGTQRREIERANEAQDLYGGPKVEPALTAHSDASRDVLSLMSHYPRYINPYAGATTATRPKRKRENCAYFSLRLQG